MRLRRLLTRLWELQHPPIASSILMLLLCLFWLMGIGDNLALVPSQVFRHSQILFAAYRLVIYCLYHTDATHLLFNLLLFPLLGWAQELHLGTCRYLYVSLLGAVIPALLYILLAVLYDTQFDTAVGGYTPVHLAMLGYHQRQEKQRGILGVILAALVASLLLGLCQILSPNSPFLLHSCGLLTCLACILLLPFESAIQLITGQHLYYWPPRPPPMAVNSIVYSAVFFRSRRVSRVSL